MNGHVGASDYPLMSVSQHALVQIADFHDALPGTRVPRCPSLALPSERWNEATDQQATAGVCPLWPLSTG
jgi:hypothetical protein